MPAPLPSLVVLKPAFDPGPQAIPRPMHLLWRQVGDNDPGLFIPRLSTEEQSAFQLVLLVGKTRHPLRPLRSGGGEPVGDPFPPIAARKPGFGPQIDAQERMPALRHDLSIQPGSIQAAI